MYRSTEEQRMSRRFGLSLLGLFLLVCLSGTSRADSDGYLTSMDAQSLNLMAQQAAGGSSVLVCGGQSGHRVASLRIHGSDIAALWHNAYRMIVPSAALADTKSPEVGVSNLPHKGPVWGINISHGDALVTLQSKW
jgi:hypothetical protein